MSIKKTGMETHTNRKLLLAALSVLSLGLSSPAFAEDESACKTLEKEAGESALKITDAKTEEERKKTEEECQASLDKREREAVNQLIQFELDPELVKKMTDRAAEQQKDIDAQIAKGSAELDAFSCASQNNTLRLCGTAWVQDIYTLPEPKPKAPCALVNAIAVNGMKTAVIAVGERGHILKAQLVDIDSPSKEAFNLDQICSVKRGERETEAWREKYGPSGDAIGENVASMKAEAIAAEVKYDGSGKATDPDYPYYQDGEVPSVWKQIVNIKGGTRVPLTDVFFVEGTKIGFIVGYDGVILKTTDDGDSWKMVKSIPPGSDRKPTAGKTANDMIDNDVPETNFFGIYMRSDNRHKGKMGWAVGSRGNIYGTNDFGETWNNIPLQPSAEVQATYGEAENKLYSPARDAQYNSIEELGDGSLLATGGDGFMIRSNDRGATWVAHTSLTVDSLISHCYDNLQQSGINREKLICQECKSTETLNRATGKCELTCPAGQIKNDAGVCTVAVCEGDAKWNDAEQACVTTCAEGSVFSDAEQACVEVLECGEGEAWNSDDAECTELPVCEDDTVPNPVEKFEECVSTDERDELIAEAKEAAEEAAQEAAEEAAAAENNEQPVGRYIGAIFGQVPLDDGRVVIHSMSGSALVSGKLGTSAVGASNADIIGSWRRYDLPNLKVSFFGGTRLRSGAVVLVGAKGTIVVSPTNAATMTVIDAKIDGEPDLVDVIEHPTKDGLLIIVGDGGVFRHQLK